MGKLLFYEKAIDLTILVALVKIAAEKTSGTIETKKKMHKLLHHCATHPNYMLRYKANGMVLKAHSDTSYFL